MLGLPTTKATCFALQNENDDWWGQLSEDRKWWGQEMIRSVGDETRDAEGISAWSLWAAPELSQERKLKTESENKIRERRNFKNPSVFWLKNHTALKNCSSDRLSRVPVVYIHYILSDNMNKWQQSSNTVKCEDQKDRPVLKKTYYFKSSLNVLTRKISVKPLVHAAQWWSNLNRFFMCTSPVC